MRISGRAENAPSDDAAAVRAARPRNRVIAGNGLGARLKIARKPFRLITTRLRTRGWRRWTVVITSSAIIIIIGYYRSSSAFRVGGFAKTERTAEAPPVCQPTPSPFSRSSAFVSFHLELLPSYNPCRCVFPCIFLKNTTRPGQRTEPHTRCRRWNSGAGWGSWWLCWVADLPLLLFLARS